MNPAEQWANMLDQIPALISGVEEGVNGWLTAEYTGTADDGRIVAKVRGSGEPIELKIDIMSKRRLDNITLGESITEAIRAAEAQAEQAKSQLFGSLTISGMNIGEMMEKGPAALAQSLLEQQEGQGS